MYKRKIGNFYFEKEEKGTLIQIYRNGDPDPVAHISVDANASMKDLDYDVMQWYSDNG